MCLVPSERDFAKLSLLVVIVVAFVFVENELSVSTWIDTDFEVVPCLLA